MKFTKRFKLKGNNPKMSILKAKITSIMNEGGSSEEITNIESQIKELVDEDLAKDLKNRKNHNILEDERPSKAFLNLENA